jgi:hypothetical protein
MINLLEIKVIFTTTKLNNYGYASKLKKFISSKYF